MHKHDVTVGPCRQAPPRSRAWCRGACASSPPGRLGEVDDCHRPPGPAASSGRTGAQSSISGSGSLSSESVLHYTPPGYTAPLRAAQAMTPRAAAGHPTSENAPSPSRRARPRCRRPAGDLDNVRSRKPRSVDAGNSSGSARYRTALLGLPDGQLAQTRSSPRGHRIRGSTGASTSARELSRSETSDRTISASPRRSAHVLRSIHGCPRVCEPGVLRRW